MGTPGTGREFTPEERYETGNSAYLDNLEKKMIESGDFIAGRTGKKRDVISGWSSGVARRHVKWLYSVSTDDSDLTGHGYAVTLTSRDFPETAEAYHALRIAYVRRLQRLGDFLRLHWVIEWQRRGAPHLHMAVYYREKLAPAKETKLLSSWLDLCTKNGYKALLQSQDVKDIKGTRGWLKYLSKHSGRSAAHYQRMGMPPGWEKSGRLWGHIGDWVTAEPQKVVLNRKESAIFRRLVDAYLLHDAKRNNDVRREKYLKYRRRKEKDSALSSVMGISDWVPEDIAYQLLIRAMVNNSVHQGVSEKYAYQHAFSRIQAVN